MQGRKQESCDLTNDLFLIPIIVLRITCKLCFHAQHQLCGGLAPVVRRLVICINDVL